MSFSFVHYEGPKLSADPNVRKVIRQHAMRDIASTRRQKGNYGQHNLVQFPVSLDKIELLSTREASSNDAVGLQNQEVTLTDRNLERKRLAVPHGSPSAPPIPKARFIVIMPKDFSLLMNLMPLTGLRLGIAPFSHLTAQSTWTKELLSTPHLGSRKFLSFIPSRYGQVPALRHATDCVVAKLRQMMLPEDSRLPNDDAAILLHYTKALKALQTALNDETQRLLPETLCATELLGIFETLNGDSQAHSWIHHAAGATRLIECRGPHRFSTEYETTLFMEHLGPIVMEAFLNNRSCFLVEEKWQKVIRSAIYNDESLGSQKDLAFTLWGNLVRLPEEFRNATDLIKQQNPPQGRVDALMERLQGALINLIRWQAHAQRVTNLEDGEIGEYEDGFSSSRSTFDNRSHPGGRITQLGLQGTFIACRMLKSRLLYALAPSRFHLLENDCQDLATKIIEMGQKPMQDDGEKLIWVTIVAQCSWIAKGILQTREIWNEGWETQRGTIDEWKYEIWRSAIKGKLPEVQK